MKNLPESPCYRERRAPFLTLFNLKGDAVALNLAHIDRINYGDEGITITNGKQQLVIQGFNLEPLFLSIAAGEIAEVRALDPHDRAPLSTIWVERICKVVKQSTGAH